MAGAIAAILVVCILLSMMFYYNNKQTQHQVIQQQVTGKQHTNTNTNSNTNTNTNSNSDSNTNSNSDSNTNSNSDSNVKKSHQQMSQQTTTSLPSPLSFTQPVAPGISGNIVPYQQKSIQSKPLLGDSVMLNVSSGTYHGPTQL